MAAPLSSAELSALTARLTRVSSRARAEPNKGYLGSAIPGSAIPGSAIPGSAIPGSALPGSASPGLGAGGRTLVGPGVESVAYRVEGMVARDAREAADQAAAHMQRHPDQGEAQSCE